MSKVVRVGERHTYSELENKYRNFFAPAIKIVVDGTSLASIGAAVSYLNIQTSSKSAADAFTFTIGNAYDPVNREFKWLDQYFRLATYIEISIGYADKLTTLFKGLITKVDIKYPEDGMPTLTVSGMDQSFIMMSGKKSKTWKNIKYSDVVRDIGKKYGLELQVEETSVVHDIVEKHATSDFNFVNSLAIKLNYEFYVVDNTLYFKKPHKGEKIPVVTLEWGKNLRHFTTSINLADQVNKVVVRGPDKNNHSKAIEGSSKEIDRLGHNTTTGKDLLQTVAKEITTYHAYRVVKSKQDAEERANAILNMKAMNLVKGSGECIGIPEMRAGNYVEIKGLGKSNNTLFYLETVTHVISSGGYTTSFTVGGNAI